MSDGGLAPGVTKHYYSVRAVNDQGDRPDWSALRIGNDESRNCSRTRLSLTF